MHKRIKRVVAGMALSGALAGGALAGTAAFTATPASGTGWISFFHSTCAPHGHEIIFCEGSSASSDVTAKENIVPVVW